MSHHRRLALQPEADRGVVFINLLFLMSIIFLPAINSVFTNDTNNEVAAVLYGLHLTTVAALNALLWALATQDLRRRVLASLSMIIFALGTIVAFFAPSKAMYVFMLAFVSPFIDRLLPEQAENSSAPL